MDFHTWSHLKKCYAKITYKEFYDVYLMVSRNRSRSKFLSNLCKRIIGREDMLYGSEQNQASPYELLLLQFEFSIEQELGFVDHHDKITFT